MRSARLVPLTGFVLFSLGLAPLLAKGVPTNPAEPAAVESATAVESAGPMEPPAVVVTETVEIAAPEVSGLPGSVTRVLHSKGFLGGEESADIAAELPPSVVAALVASGAVLPVAVPGEGP